VFARLPEWLPIIGGNLTLNAFVYGVSSALAISTLLFAAATFNSAIRHGDLIRILPASFSRFGIAGSIALTFVPQTMSAGRDIYDAQRARGHRFRRPRDTRAFALPLLGVSLERAMVLSEALETRGFGSSTSRPSRSRLSKVALAVGGFSLIAALVFIAIGDLILGLSMVIATLVCVLAGRPSTYRRTRLRTMVWNVPSVAVAIAAMVPVGLVLANIITGFSLAFEPFPVLEMPDFSALAGLAIACLLTPAIWSRR
jgi:hypothetical protein